MKSSQKTSTSKHSSDIKSDKKTIIVNEFKIPQELQIYDEAYSYFEVNPIFVELREDISNRFAYLGNFLEDVCEILKRDPKRNVNDIINKKDHKHNVSCCDITDNLDDMLLTIINACLYERQKYTHVWKCKKLVSMTDFTSIIQIKEWVISGRCIMCQTKAFNKSSSLQGCILNDASYECHKIHGRNPVDSYDLFYTYITRLINVKQLHICEDTSCCFPKDKSNLFSLNINTYKDIVLNSVCTCGSNKRFKHCCHKS